MIQLEYRPPQPRRPYPTGTIARFTAGVGVGFAVVAFSAFVGQDGDIVCAMIGLVLDLVAIAFLFAIANLVRSRNDPNRLFEVGRLRTFFIGIGCFVLAAGIAYLLHFLVSEDATVLFFFAIGAVLTLASPWLVFRRRQE